MNAHLEVVNWQILFKAIEIDNMRNMKSEEFRMKLERSNIMVL